MHQNAHGSKLSNMLAHIRAGTDARARIKFTRTRARTYTLRAHVGIKSQLSQENQKKHLTKQKK